MGVPWFTFKSSWMFPVLTLRRKQVDAELERFDKAILETRAEIVDVRDKIAQSLGEGEAGIFDAHLLVLEDNALSKRYRRSSRLR